MIVFRKWMNQGLLLREICLTITNLLFFLRWIKYSKKYHYDQILEMTIKYKKTTIFNGKFSQKTILLFWLSMSSDRNYRRRTSKQKYMFDKSEWIRNQLIWNQPETRIMENFHFICGNSCILFKNSDAQHFSVTAWFKQLKWSESNSIRKFYFCFEIRPRTLFILKNFEKQKMEFF